MNVRKEYRELKEICKSIIAVYSGFKTLKQTSRTPDFAYSAMKKLFVLTNGRSNDVISAIIRRPKFDDVEYSGVLGLRSREHLREIVQDIRLNGYHIFDARLPITTVDSIIGFAVKTPTKYRLMNDDNKGLKIAFSEDVLFDEAKVESPVYQFSQKDILSSSDLQRLIFDQSLLSLAQEYLGTRPFLDLLAMWWSVPFQGRGKSESAQMFHFDLDRIKFLKFFFYLTDVGGQTGPHCYVKGSHKRLPTAVKRQGRISDDDVASAFGNGNILELCGQKGTIIAVDTRGLHKGKDLTRDKRLLFQVEFANSMFGQYYAPVEKPVLPNELADLYSRHIDTYGQIIREKV